MDLPEEEVPPELPEPVLGINFARDGMNRCAALARPKRRSEEFLSLTGFAPPTLPASRKDWVALIAVHSDAWLMAVAIYYGATLENGERLKMFKKLNPAGAPTLYRQVKNYPHPPFITDEPPNKKKKQLATTSEPPLAKSCTGLKAAAEAEAERCPPSKPGDNAQPLPGQEAEQQGAGVGEPEVDVDALVHALQTLAPGVPK